MDFCRKTILLLIFSSSMSIGWGQDCDIGYTDIDEYCYNQSDLDVLQQFIDNSQGGNYPPPSDLSPIRLGYQVWEDGNLVHLCFSYSSDFECVVTDYTLSGEIPTEIGNLVNLTFLELSYTQLSGEIPTEIGNLVNLTSLKLNDNEFISHLPLEIGNLINLERLFLENNQFTGEIPTEINNLVNTNYINLSNNQFTGLIPIDIGNLENLHGLKLSDNQLSGEISDNICNLVENDCNLYIYNNQLCPPYPYCIEGNQGYQDLSECGDCSSFGDGYEELWGDCYSIEETTILDLSGSWDSVGELTGSIPSEIGNFINLTYLDLSFNQLIGEIPESIDNLNNLVFLSLHSNQLNGGIPLEIGNLINLKWLYLYNNQLTGAIPESVGNLYNLDFLSLHSNQLTGEIPQSLCNNYQNIDYIVLDINHLCPPYPECLTEENIGYQDTSECVDCPDSIEGDIDSDGEVTILDIVLILNCILSNNCDECYDWNFDGNVDVLDIILMINIILTP